MEPKGYHQGPKWSQKRAKWRPEGAKNTPNGAQRVPKMSHMATRGYPRGGSENQVAKRTVRGGKPYSKWSPFGTKNRNVGVFFWYFFNVFPRSFFMDVDQKWSQNVFGTIWSELSYGGRSFWRSGSRNLRGGTPKTDFDAILAGFGSQFGRFGIGF